MRRSSTRYVLVAITGDGPLELPRVWGPWRSRARAEAALARYDAVLEDLYVDTGYPAEVVTLDPEYEDGSGRGLHAFLRAKKAAAQ